MSGYDAAAASNILYGYVFEGVWQKYNVPISQKWIWTLRSSNAIIVLGFFALLLTLSQSRMWALLRYFIYLRHKAVRLDDERPDPLKHLSQTQAIAEILPSIVYYASKLRLVARSSFRRGADPHAAELDKLARPESPVISPWFGILALFNLGLFGVMGVVLPVILSDGALGAPIVRSKAGDYCSEEPPPGRIIVTESDSPRIRTDAIFEVCLNRLDHGCGSQYYIQQPQITKSSTACPFSKHVCYNTPNAPNSFEISRSNITSYELGANSPSKLALNHRLTCAPIHLEPFLVLNSQDTLHSSVNISILNAEFEIDGDRDGDLEYLRRVLTKLLQTLNGPNIFSNESSGLRMSLENGRQDLTILPEHPIPSRYRSNASQLFQKYLQTNRGQAFLIIKRPGNSAFCGVGFQPVDDPFFASHTRRPVDDYRNEGDTGLPSFDPQYLETHRPYYPDREASALGCVEQFQFCVSITGRCTSWESNSQDFVKRSKSLMLREQVDLSSEPWIFLSSLPNMLSVSLYFQTPKSPQMSGSSLDSFNTPNPGVNIRKDQWITEVETWFMRRVIEAILYTQYLVRSPESIFSYFSEDKLAMPGAFCKGGTLHGGILFRDPDFTNINWVGFWITIVLLTLICITSYTIEWIEKRVRATWSPFCTFKKYLYKKIISAGAIRKAILTDALSTKVKISIWGWFLGGRRHSLSQNILGYGSATFASGSHSSELQQIGRDANKNGDVGGEDVNVDNLV